MKHNTHKNTLAGKHNTLSRKARRATKFMVTPLDLDRIALDLNARIA